MPGIAARFTGVERILELIHSQVDSLTDVQLEEDYSLGKDVKVAFYCGKRGWKIFDFYKRGLLPDLKLVCNYGVGVNHMPMELFKEHGLILANTPDVLSDGTADMAFALMLASGRKLKLGWYFGTA